MPFSLGEPSHDGPSHTRQSHRECLGAGQQGDRCVPQHQRSFTAIPCHASTRREAPLRQNGNLCGTSIRQRAEPPTRRGTPSGFGPCPCGNTPENPTSHERRRFSPRRTKIQRPGASHRATAYAAGENTRRRRAAPVGTPRGGHPRPNSVSSDPDIAGRSRHPQRATPRTSKGSSARRDRIATRPA
jgi:hypothetical protein